MKTIKLLVISAEQADAAIITQYCNQINKWLIIVEHQTKSEEIGKDADLLILDKSHDPQLELLAQLRNAGEDRPIIIMIDDLDNPSTTVTTMIQNDDIDAFKQLGADDWIAKSRISTSSLKRAIYNAMEQHRLRQMVSDALSNIKHFYVKKKKDCTECRDQIKQSIQTIKQATVILSKMEHDHKRLEYLEVIQYCCIQIEVHLRKEDK